MTQSLPPFSSLPYTKGDPPYSAWGLYGPDDQLGTLNRLTNEVVLEASKEIQTGIRISLDEPLDQYGDKPFFGRHSFKKEIIWRRPRCVNDDTWSFNTQSSSQWDGLRHFAYQEEEKFYNGVTQADIHGPSANNKNGVHIMSERGIVGRGILLDYHSWRLKHGIEHSDFFKTDSIKLKHLQACAKDQGTEIKFGDILLIRAGYTLARKAIPDERIEYLRHVQPPNFTGVEQSVEMLQWIWENFSAVASDLVPFEQYPPQSKPALHEVLLAGWGCPIGEMFNLEELAETCTKLGRWSFFLTSKVNNVPGGVASPPNILAIL